MSSESDSMQRSLSSPPSSPQLGKKIRLDEQALHEQTTAMKEKGFSLSAIAEMKTRVEENNQSGTLDQQLRQFQVLDEVQGSGTDDSGKLCSFLTLELLLKKIIIFVVNNTLEHILLDCWIPQSGEKGVRLSDN